MFEDTYEVDAFTTLDAYMTLDTHLIHNDYTNAFTSRVLDNPFTCLAPSAVLPRRLADDFAAFQEVRLVRCLEAVALVSLKAQLTH